ncbi:hypothetical protein ISS96_02015 [Candidatus Bathyarchaeota archaeon]|nr:hypothetical protein [Candidatus Bathyarchaeota archaeon]
MGKVYRPEDLTPSKTPRVSDLATRPPLTPLMRPEIEALRQEIEAIKKEMEKIRQALRAHGIIVE